MFRSPNISLKDLLGADYAKAVCNAAVYNGYATPEQAEAIISEKVDFMSEERQAANEKMLSDVGKSVVDAFETDNNGAATDAFAKALHKTMAPLSARGLCRIGEDGKVYFIGKSEHYHASLGHGFGGYKLIDNARKLGIPNATHNNTRGYITRLAERELIRAANGNVSDEELEKILASREPKVLNRCINLETGSLACEAGLKMMLARFYKLDGTFAEPKYYGKTPVFFVMADMNGTNEANYHGTTVIAQTLRGLWGGFAKAAEDAGLYKVVPVMINDLADFEAKLKQYNSGKYKTAGFSHEIILMNYGAIRLTKEFLQGAYKLCAEYDTPTMCDEIQSCMWYDGMFLFRKWGLNPDFAVVGKGFPGGEYPASKLITTAEMDALNLFGALVTNGQEELASLAYLITMEWSKANNEQIKNAGEYFYSELEKLAKENSELIVRADGFGHLAGLRFAKIDEAAKFAQILNDMCIDISAQLYKANCPPVVLVKPPLIASEYTMDFLCGKIREAIKLM
ncbi:MAG: aminotransferase class III-fold pyridoxal phosphate-dependent enzyme [Clostridia bacterium]|nr:aminotransferase class III-fold pyridoxal phosphate-dependent enzyme [Clostridia bacterium]